MAIKVGPSAITAAATGVLSTIDNSRAHPAAGGRCQPTAHPQTYLTRTTLFGPDVRTGGIHIAAATKAIILMTDGFVTWGQDLLNRWR